MFLFDEPLSNLDAKLRVAMRVEIRKLQRRLTTTSIYVTHDQVEAMTLADMLVVMNGGQVEQIGTPLEIYQKPADHFRRRLHRLAADEPAFAARLRHQAAGRSAPRPEFSAFVPKTSRSVTVRHPTAASRSTSPWRRSSGLGPETYVYGIRSQQGDTPAVSSRPGELPPGEILVRIPGQEGPAVGEKIRAVAPREKLHLFTADGRKRVNS